MICNAKGDRVLEQTTTETGRFERIELGVGRYTLSLGAGGFLSEVIDIEIPHSGHLEGCRIRMTPIRALTMRRYAHFVKEQINSPHVTHRQTPREIAAELTNKAQFSASVIERLTNAFESLYFGGNHRVNEARHQEVVDYIEQAETPDRTVNS